MNDERMDSFDEWLDEVDEDIQRTKPAGGGGDGSKSIPAWKLRQQYVRLGEDPVWVHLYPGNYGGRPLYKYFSAWLANKNGQKRQVFCVCAAEKKKVPCVLCYYRKKEENSDYAPRVKVLCNAIITEDFHWLERKSDSGATWKEPVLCQGVDRLGRSQCEYCEKGIAKSFGLRRFLSLGPGYHRDFKAVISKVRSVCKSCGGSLLPNKYVCGSCNTLFVDLNKSAVSAARRKYFEEQKIACPNCGEVARAKPTYGCYKIVDPEDPESVEPGCSNPVPCTIFDMPLRLKVSSGKQGSSLLCVNTDAQWKYRPMDPRAAELAKPYDFEELFGTMPLDEQARLMGRPNPYKEGKVPEEDESDVDPYA